jgi:HSP20 family molecular chaperone IbpA
VAAFSPDEVSITAEQTVVTIEDGKTENAEREFLYWGISTRHFKRQSNLADYARSGEGARPSTTACSRSGPDDERYI